ncbi:hypothetical protein BDN70DRAFT_822282 [Pholiota conissans]|uniref:F-box domain-containing protein n=1 Tax=Pholiota conissans TaxID=109636 RepID=A0A9P6D886_9AGAR|nr:hypothetical protein BDN70DRAFT_822282 [Pholiota conissans]
MNVFDFFPKLSATRVWLLRAFSSGNLPHSSFYTAPRAIQHDVSSSVSFMTTPTTALDLSDTPPMPSQTSTPTITTTPASAQMPLELILAIVETACTEGTEEARMDLLTNCSLVCRTWSAASQRLLFSKVTLRSQRSFELFMSAVDRTIPHRSSLADAVKHLTVILDHKQPSGLHPNSLALAVTACPNLRHLGISLYGCAEPGKDVVGAPDVLRLRRAAPSFDDHTLSLLKSGPAIESLHFDNWSENQQSIFQLLDIWPSLRFLSISGTPPQHLQDSPPPFPCALRGVRFNFQSSPSADFMEWLLHNSVTSLKSLHFDRDPSVAVFEYLVNVHGQNLHSISLPGFGSPALVPLAAQAKHLRELRTENPILASANYAPATFPDEIEHLSFGLDRNTPLASIIDLIKAKDALKTVTAQVWDGGLHHPLFAPLKIACMYRGVDLTVTEDLQVSRVVRTCDSPKSAW